MYDSNNNQQLTITEIRSQNRFESLIDEGENKIPGQLEQEHNHENSKANNTQSTHDLGEKFEQNANHDQSVELLPPQIKTPRQTFNKVNNQRANNTLNNQGQTSTSDSPIVIIGVSIRKNINPKKIFKKQVVKRTFPGKNAEDIKSETKSIPTSSTPSHIIIHARKTTFRQIQHENVLKTLKNLLIV